LKERQQINEWWRSDEVVVVVVVRYVRYLMEWNEMRERMERWIWMDMMWVELSWVAWFNCREREREREGEERVACGRLENIIAAYGIDV
jgi:hypothetical protein